MGRPRLTRAEQRERTRTEILDAAYSVFSARGFTRASVDEIAETAGYTKGAVYSNFTGKEDLFLALMERRAALEAQAVADAATQTVGGQMTGAAVEGAPEIGPSGWALATLDFFVTAVRNPESRARLAEGYRQSRERLGPSLVGSAPPQWATPAEIATLAMAVGSGLIIQAAVDPDAVPSDLYERALKRLLEP